MKEGGAKKEKKVVRKRKCERRGERRMSKVVEGKEKEGGKRMRKRKKRNKERSNRLKKWEKQE